MTKIDVEEFARRAASGEKPILRWVKRGYRYEIGRMNRPVVEKQEGKASLFYLLPIEWADQPIPFKNATAAQLASEHLLREATRPLFAKQAERVAELEDLLVGFAEKMGLDIENGDSLLPDSAINYMLGDWIAFRGQELSELKAALSELVRVNETDAGDDPAEWAAAMLAARKALGIGDGERSTKGDLT
jgi:hypothetical protein